MDKRKSSEFGDEGHKDKRQKLAEETDPCLLCLEPIDVDVTVTPYGHRYHTHCILSSFQTDNRCPMCRSPIDELAGIPYSGPGSIMTGQGTARRRAARYQGRLQSAGPATPRSRTQRTANTRTAARIRSSTSRAVMAAEGFLLQVFLGFLSQFLLQFLLGP